MGAIEQKLTRIRHKRIFRAIGLLQTLYKLRVFVLKFGRVCLFDPIVILSRAARDDDEELLYSSIFSPSLTTLRAAESSIGLVRSMLNDSIQTLSVRVVRMSHDCRLIQWGVSPMLWASSNTTIASFDNSLDTCSATFGSRR